MGETEPNTSKNVTNLFIIWWAVTVQENVCKQRSPSISDDGFYDCKVQQLDRCMNSLSYRRPSCWLKTTLRRWLLQSGSYFHQGKFYILRRMKKAGEKLLFVALYFLSGGRGYVTLKFLNEFLISLIVGHFISYLKLK